MVLLVGIIAVAIIAAIVTACVTSFGFKYELYSGSDSSTWFKKS